MGERCCQSKADVTGPPGTSAAPVGFSRGNGNAECQPPPAIIAVTSSKLLFLNTYYAPAVRLKPCSFQLIKANSPLRRTPTIPSFQKRKHTGKGQVISLRSH